MRKVVVALLFYFLLFAGSACGLMRGEEVRLAEGISVDGIEVGRVSRAEAEARLGSIIQEKLAQKVTVIAKQRAFSAELRELGVSTNVKQVLDQVYGQTPLGAAQIKNLSLSLELQLDENLAKEALEKMTQELNRPAQDAVFKVSLNNTVEVIAHRVGSEVNVAKAVQDLTKIINQDKERTINLEVREVAPSVTANALEPQKFDTLLASFTTSSASDPNRVENLKNAAQAIDMLVLKPGEVFSFNQIVGPRTEETGYKEAPIIIRNELVPGIGGGVCQVSSTLYNVALLADLEILERHPHEFAIAYLPPGRDATVVYDRLDLRFKNNTQGLLLVRTEVKGGTLKILMFGKKNNKKVELQTVIEDSKPFTTERRFDPSLAPGQAIKDQGGVKGYTVKTFRVVKINNQEVKREDLGRNYYKPAKRIFRVGPSARRSNIPE